MRALLVAVVVAVVAGSLFAGCTGRATVSTAKPLLSTAQKQAILWQADAQLVGVAGLEGNLTQAPAQLTFPAQDTQVGDGKTPGWLFVFGSQAARSRLSLALDAAGDVTNRTVEEWSRNAVVHPEEWRVDSDDALERAKAKNATLRQVVAEPKATLVEVLANFTQARPAWLLMAGSGKETVFLSVDASNGTVHEFSPGSEFGGGIPDLNTTFFSRESGEASGRVDAASPSLQSSIVLHAAHARMAVAVVDKDPTLPGQRISFVVKDSAGHPVLFVNHTRATGVSDVPDTAVLAHPAAQSYVVTATLDPPGASGIAADYDLSWCTDGGAPFGIDLAPPPAACKGA